MGSRKGGAPVPDSRREFRAWWNDGPLARNATPVQAFEAGFEAAMRRASPLDQLLYQAGKAKAEGKTVELRLIEVGKAPHSSLRLELRIEEDD